MKNRHLERGSHHLVLVMVAVIALIGLLGFVGYNTWKKQNTNAGGTSTLGTGFVSLKANDMFNSQQAHLDCYQPGATVTPNCPKVGSDFKAKYVITDGSSGKVYKLPAWSGASNAGYAEVSYDTDPTTGDITAFKDFLLSAANKKVKACVTLRAAGTIPKDPTPKSPQNVMGLRLFTFGDGSSRWTEYFTITNSYTQHCFTTPTMPTKATIQRKLGSYVGSSIQLVEPTSYQVKSWPAVYVKSITLKAI